jgi:hypothetical protein
MDPEATVVDVGLLGSEHAHQSIVYLTGSAVRAYHLTGTAHPVPTTLLKIPTMTVSPEPSDLPPYASSPIGRARGGRGSESRSSADSCSTPSALLDRKAQQKQSLSISRPCCSVTIRSTA